MDTVYCTAATSLIAQIAIGGVTGSAFFLFDGERKDDPLLVTVLALEFASQVVEFLWYVFVLCAYSRIETWMRYADWVVSTPVMLVSMALFFQHRGGGDAWGAPWLPISLVLNWCMLACGYAVETSRVLRVRGVLAGIVAFVGSFAALATSVPEEDAISQGVFWVVYAVWSLYGLAALLPYAPKNVLYNLLDVGSKNCFGLFLFVYVVAM